MPPPAPTPALNQFHLIAFPNPPPPPPPSPDQPTGLRSTVPPSLRVMWGRGLQYHHHSGSCGAEVYSTTITQGHVGQRSTVPPSLRVMWGRGLQYHHHSGSCGAEVYSTTITQGHVGQRSTVPPSLRVMWGTTITQGYVGQWLSQKVYFCVCSIQMMPSVGWVIGCNLTG